MSPTKRSERQTEIEIEQEVDFGRYLRLLGRGWWLLLGGLVVGAVLAVALTLGGGNLYKATATIYLGQPLAVSSSAGIQDLATNPSTVTQLVHTESVLRATAASSGLPLKKLRGGISTSTVTGFLSKLGQTPLVTISVQAHASGTKVSKAANALARLVVTTTSDYPDAKIASFREQIKADERELAVIDKRLSALNKSFTASGTSSFEQQVLLTAENIAEARRGSVSGDLDQNRLLLVQALDVEKGTVVDKATAIKTAAHSRKNALVVGGALGLLIGALLALTLPGFRRERSS
ncbi:MAG: hypothetical protein ABSC36_02545 [Gaiellaceae bacterium]|jgi:uncharacterized protein involved in exopolysaccharide biosynthesis